MIALVIAGPAVADIVTDGTLGPMVELTGPDNEIHSELGQTRGRNLFHSFQRFDIPAGHRATFTGPDHIEHVVSRVTGGTLSHIDGQLRSDIGQADLYLINPAGLVMGPNATVDVPASLHLSTADELRLRDGSRFSASEPATSELSLAPPEAFGFLGRHPVGDLRIHGSQLALQPGQTLNLNAGHLSIQGDSQNPARLSSVGGEIRISALGNQHATVPVEVPANAPHNTISYQGALTVAHASLTTSGPGGGLIRARAGTADLVDAQVRAENTGLADAMGVGIDAAIAGGFNLQDSLLSTDTLPFWLGGDIQLRAADLSLENTLVTSDSNQSSDPLGEPRIGGAGRISAVLDGLLLVKDGSRLSSWTWTNGNAGDIDIIARAARLDGTGLKDDVTGLSSLSAPGSSGDAGTIRLRVAEQLDLLNGAQISSSTFAQGRAGDIRITAGSARLDGNWQGHGLVGQVTAIGSRASRGFSGDAGTIAMEIAGALEVLRGAQISTSTLSSGNAGQVRISAGSARFDGAGMDSFTGLASTAEPGSRGHAGKITLQVAGLLEIVQGAAVSTSTFSFGSAGGQAGDLDITAGSARLDGGHLTEQPTGLFGEAGSDFSGNAGTIAFNVRDGLDIIGGAEISTNTRGLADAGSVSVSARDIHLAGGVIGSVAEIDANGRAGAVSIRSRQGLRLDDSAITIESRNPQARIPTTGLEASSDGPGLRVDTAALGLRNSRISAASAGAVPAARIEIAADETRLTAESRITTQSELADAGPIRMAGGHLWLDNSRITTSAEGPLGNGGDIDLATKQLILEGGFIQANTAALDAKGGDIKIGATALIASQDQLSIGALDRQRFIANSGRNVIQAAAPLGIQGRIDLAMPELDINADLVPLGTRFQDPDAILSNLCQLADAERASALIERGAGGPAPSAGSALSNSLGGKRLERLIGPPRP